MQVTPSIAETYPAELAALIEDFPSPDLCSPQQQRVINLATDSAVMEYAAPILRTIEQAEGDERLNLIAEFWEFLEMLTSIPDRQPAGSVLNTSPPQFIPADQLTGEIQRAAIAARDLAETLPNITTTIKTEGYQHIEQLRALSSLCFQTLAAFAIEPALNPGRSPEIWQEWLRREVGIVASLSMPDASPLFLDAISEALSLMMRGEYY